MESIHPHNTMLDLINAINENFAEIATGGYAFAHHMATADQCAMSSPENMAATVFRSVFTAVLAGLITHYAKASITFLIKKIKHRS